MLSIISKSAIASPTTELIIFTKYFKLHTDWFEVLLKCELWNMAIQKNELKQWNALANKHKTYEWISLKNRSENKTVPWPFASKYIPTSNLCASLCKYFTPVGTIDTGRP